MEYAAHGFEVGLGFSVEAGVAACLAAVGVVVEDLLIQSTTATRRLGEPDRHGNAAPDGKGVGDLAGFEEDDFFGVDGADGGVGFLGHGEEFGAVEFLRVEEEHDVFVEVADPGFVQDVVADHIIITPKLGRHHFPKLEHLILQPIHIIIKLLKCMAILRAGV